MNTASSCTTSSKAGNISVKFLKPTKTKTTRPIARHAQIQEENDDDVVEIESDNDDAAETEGQPIPVQIGNRPGNGKPNLKREHDVDSSDELEYECGSAGNAAAIPTMY